MAQKGTSKTASAEAQKTAGVQPNTKIPTTLLPRELYTDVIRLAAFNKVKKTGPQNDSAVLREALNSLLAFVGFNYQKIDILDAPKPAYKKKLEQIHKKSVLDGGVRKTFSITLPDYEAAEAFASYNKMHELLPKNISQVCRDALEFYIENIDYEFRPR